jgi:hypothetical protein
MGKKKKFEEEMVERREQWKKGTIDDIGKERALAYGERKNNSSRERERGGKKEKVMVEGENVQQRGKNDGKGSKAMVEGRD